MGGGDSGSASGGRGWLVVVVGDGSGGRGWRIVVIVDGSCSDCDK